MAGGTWKFAVTRSLKEALSSNSFVSVQADPADAGVSFESAPYGYPSSSSPLYVVAEKDRGASVLISAGTFQVQDVSNLTLEAVRGWDENGVLYVFSPVVDTNISTPVDLYGIRLILSYSASVASASVADTVTIA